MNTDAVGREKRRLRRLALEWRACLRSSEPRRQGEAILCHLEGVPEFVAARGILLCMPFRAEPDLTALLEEPPPGVTFHLPRAVPETGELAIHPFPVELHQTKWGLLEPVPGSPVIPAERLDVLLVPGVAFAEGTLQRLGYGGGYFDRFLARHRIPALGYGYGEAVLPFLPWWPADRSMDAVVTPWGVLRRSC